MFACIHSPHAAELARSFSPWVEIVDETTAVFSLTPRQLADRAWKRIPVEQAGARVAVSSTVEAAILAARNLPGYTFIAPGEEARVLGALPIDCLANSAPSPTVRERWCSTCFETLDPGASATLDRPGRLPEDGFSRASGRARRVAAKAGARRV